MTEMTTFEYRAIVRHFHCSLLRTTLPDSFSFRNYLCTGHVQVDPRDCKSCYALMVSAGEMRDPSKNYSAHHTPQLLRTALLTGHVFFPRAVRVRSFRAEVTGGSAAGRWR